MSEVFYLYHPESDTLLIEQDAKAVEEMFENTPELVELEYERYIEILNEQDDYVRNEKIKSRQKG